MKVSSLYMHIFQLLIANGLWTKCFPSDHVIEPVTAPLAAVLVREKVTWKASFFTLLVNWSLLGTTFTSRPAGVLTATV